MTFSRIAMAGLVFAAACGENGQQKSHDVLDTTSLGPPKTAVPDAQAPLRDAGEAPRDAGAAGTPVRDSGTVDGGRDSGTVDGGRDGGGIATVDGGDAQPPGGPVSIDIRSDGTVAGNSRSPSLSGDGNRVAFVYLRSVGQVVAIRDRSAGVTTDLLTVPALNTIQRVELSRDGTVVAFTSSDTSLDPPDAGFMADVFVHDTKTGVRSRVNVSSSGEAGQASSPPMLSGDGNLVVFTSPSPVFTGITDHLVHTYVHDRRTGETTRVDVASNGVIVPGAETHYIDPDISEDGRFVAFTENGALVPSDTNCCSDVYVHDRVTRETSIVSVSSSGAAGNGFSIGPKLSSDGRWVAFISDSRTLAPGPTGPPSWNDSAFLRDRQNGVTTLISKTPQGVPVNGDVGNLAISADGRYIAFDTDASDVVPGDTNGGRDLFVYDRIADAITRVSVGAGGAQCADGATMPSLSGDGRLIAFESSCREWRWPAATSYFTGSFLAPAP